MGVTAHVSLHRVCRVEGTAFLLKVVMTSSTVFLTDVRWLSIVLSACSLYMLWMYFYWVSAYVLALQMCPVQARLVRCFAWQTRLP